VQDRGGFGDGNEGDCGEIILGEPVIARCDSAPGFEATEWPLDCVPLSDGADIATTAHLWHY
jgi:hypothetical protein